MLIEMNLGAIVMILIGVILRSLLINHVPKFTFMMIWWLVIFRLLIPISVPDLWGQSQSVLPVMENISTRVASFSLGEGQDNLRLEEVESTSELQISSINSMRLIWISGSVVIGTYVASSHYRFRRYVSDALPVDYPFKNNIQIKETSKIDSPLTYGILHPVILMPKDINWKDVERISHVMIHEYVHIRRKDYLTKIILVAVLCVHWFNPLVWVMFTLANRDIELTCDEAVLKILGRSKRSAYAMTLLELEGKRNQFPVLAFSKNATEERVQVMINMKKKTSLLGAVVALTLVGGAMTVFPTPRLSRSNVEAGFNQLSWQTYTLLDQSNFTDFIEKNRAELSEIWPGIEDEALIIQNGEVIIFQHDMMSTFFEAPEFATVESFSSWMEQYLNELNGILTQRELNDIVVGLEATLARIESGETVIINPDRDGYSEFGSRVDWRDFKFDRSETELSNNLTLTYKEFKEWAEQDLSRREESGEYPAEDIEILSERYATYLSDYNGETNLFFVIVDDEFWGIEVSHETTKEV